MRTRGQLNDVAAAQIPSADYLPFGTHVASDVIKLRDGDYQIKLVEALFTGIRRYFARNPPLARQRAL